MIRGLGKKLSGPNYDSLEGLETQLGHFWAIVALNCKYYRDKGA